MKTTVFAVVLALFAANASAQAIYTTVAADGQKTYSDRGDAMPEPALESVTAAKEPKAPARKSHVSARLSASVNAHEAERRLAQAQQKRSAGLAPLAGESARVPGGIAVNARYWQRQEKLRIEVEQAQRRLNQVLRPQLAVQ